MTKLWARQHFGGKFKHWHLIRDNATLTLCGAVKMNVRRVEWHVGQDPPPTGKICKRCYEEPTQ